MLLCPPLGETQIMHLEPAPARAGAKDSTGQNKSEVKTADRDGNDDDADDAGDDDRTMAKTTATMTTTTKATTTTTT